jgi:hypothetical protein
VVTTTRLSHSLVAVVVIVIVVVVILLLLLLLLLMFAFEREEQALAERSLLRSCWSASWFDVALYDNCEFMKESKER